MKNRQGPSDMSITQSCEPSAPFWGQASDTLAHSLNKQQLG
jgi:hypothetical protein